MSVRRKGGGRLAEVETHFFHHITAHSAFSDFPAASQRKTFLFKPIFRASSLPLAPLKLDIFIFIHVYDIFLRVDIKTSMTFSLDGTFLFNLPIFFRFALVPQISL